MVWFNCITAFRTILDDAASCANGKDPSDSILARIVDAVAAKVKIRSCAIQGSRPEFQARTEGEAA